jgi:hypothetical protein
MREGTGVVLWPEQCMNKCMALLDKARSTKRIDFCVQNTNDMYDMHAQVAAGHQNRLG